MGLQSYSRLPGFQRFSIEFYIEGAGPARASCSRCFGLLRLPRRLLETGKSEDLYLIPTSIAYDQIQDVDSYAEQRGRRRGPKASGGRWVRCASSGDGTATSTSGWRKPVSVAKELSSAESAAEGDIDLQKLAFEVMVRINRVTPITAASGHHHVAGAPRPCRLAQRDHRRARRVGRRGEAAIAATAGDLSLGESGEVQKVLDLLAEQPGHQLHGRTEPLYLITFDQHIAAAFYRNTIIHYFVNGAIAEVGGRAVKQLLGRGADAA